MPEQKTPPSGFLLIDKPVDWTSHDVVGYLRGVTKIKKIGHAGTLDPFATGLLIVGVGRQATKRLDEFKGMHKEYVAKVQLGATSNTQDLTGEITKKTAEMPSRRAVEQVLSTFRGEIQQIPPMFSAKKIGGKKLYDLARKGVEVKREPVTVTIFELELLSCTQSELEIRVVCSAGTYIRTLAHDIGQALGTGAYCSSLRRTRIGSCHVAEAAAPKTLSKDEWSKKLLPISGLTAA